MRLKSRSSIHPLIALGAIVLACSSCWDRVEYMHSAMDDCCQFYHALYAGYVYSPGDPCVEEPLGKAAADLLKTACDHCRQLIGEDFNIGYECSVTAGFNCHTVDYFWEWFFHEFVGCSGSGATLGFADWLNEQSGDYERWPDYPECFDGCINGEPPWEHPEWYR